MGNLAATNDNQTVRTDSRAGKYLTFFLADEEYGVEILKVQEIIGTDADHAGAADLQVYPGGHQLAGQDPSHHGPQNQVRHGPDARSPTRPASSSLKPPA